MFSSHAKVCMLNSYLFLRECYLNTILKTELRSYMYNLFYVVKKCHFMWVVHVWNKPIILSQEGIITQEILLNNTFTRGHYYSRNTIDFGMFQGNTNQHDIIYLVRETFCTGIQNWVNCFSCNISRGTQKTDKIQNPKQPFKGSGHYW